MNTSRAGEKKRESADRRGTTRRRNRTRIMSLVVTTDLNLRRHIIRTILYVIIFIYKYKEYVNNCETTITPHAKSTFNDNITNRHRGARTTDECGTRETEREKNRTDRQDTGFISFIILEISKTAGKKKK